MKKRLFFLVALVVAMCVSMLAIPAAAEEVATGGTCGVGLVWSLDDAGVLTISGNGTMTNYSSSNAPWAASREAITVVVIEDSVTSIGNYAFYGCINLNYVAIGSGVVTVGEYAFYNCTALTEVVVPNNVATIGRGAFRGTSLEKITVPFVGNSMTSGNVFSYIFDTVPETLRNVVITKDTTIPAKAFEKLTLIETVTLPDGVETIGDSMFLDCTSLKRVNMGWESLRSIGNHAFNNCVALTNVGCGDYVISIPETVTTLGNYAFGSCKLFTSINVDMSGKIGEYAFASCIGATSISIGDKVTSIGNYAFLNTMITEIVVPDNVTSIGDAAFKGCPLVNMTLPFVGNTITVEGGYNGVFGYIFGYTRGGGVTSSNTSSGTGYTYQFYNGSGWSDGHYAFYIPATLRHVTITLDTTIPTNAFRNCDLIETIVLPENVETINGLAFINCAALQSIDMNWDALTSIGSSAFQNCTSLVRIGDAEKIISIPSHVITLGSYAFAGCTQFTTVNVDMVGTIGEGAFDGCTGVTSVTIGDEVTTIGNYAFRNTMITEIVVPDNVTSIGDAAFKGCPLVNMTLPFVGNTITVEGGYNGVFGYIFGYTRGGGVTSSNTSSGTGYTYQFYNGSGWSDGHYAFYIPATLRHVTITLDTTIPTNAFRNCDLIETIVLPENVETINGLAFINCVALQSIDMNWDALTSIGSSAFQNCTSLVRIGDAEKIISIPSHVITLGSYAFAGCTQFTTVSVDMVGTIGEGAFDGCTGVTSISIGDEVTTIGNYAFRNTMITEIVVPDNVTSIGDAAFKGCPLVNMTLPFVGNTITVEGGCNGVFGYIFGYTRGGGVTSSNTSSGTGYTYQFYNGSGWSDGHYAFYIPVTLRHVTITLDTTIPTNAFRNCDLIETIVLPENVETINGLAFINCAALQSIDMNWDALTSIGSSAFQNCTSLVRIGDAEKIISIPSHVITLGSYAFAGCTQFTAVTIDMVGTIGEGAFDGCTGVTSITIGDEVTTIGGYAFRNTIITEIVVPDNVTSIGVGAFQGCPLVSITVPFVGTNAAAEGTNGVFGYIFGYTTGGSSSYNTIKTSDGKGYTYQKWDGTHVLYYIPSALKYVTITLDTTIPVCAFRNCDLIETITLTEGVESIGGEAFYNCTALKSVDMGWDALTSIGNYAFYMCTSLTRIGDTEKIVSIPSNVTTLGTYAFAGCTQFTTVTVDMTGAIGDYAFNDCTAVTSITIGDGVTSIGAYAFNGCTVATSISIGKNVTSIGGYAFRNTKITEIMVPDSVTSMGTRVFEGCPLVSMTIPFIGNKIDGSNTFSYIFNGIPATLKHVTVTMDTTIPGSAFKNCALIETITLPEGVESIGSEAFYNCTALQSVDMGWDVLTTIGNHAFRNCTSLIRMGDTEKIISIPSNVTFLGEYAFANCDQFETAIINATGVIGNYAFHNCDKLTSATVSDCVNNIGYAAFYECRALGAVSIADSVTTIGRYAFDRCTGLRHVLYKGTEEQWNTMTINGDNTYLLNATRHYECSGNEVVDPVNNICQICCVHVFAGQLQHVDATCTEGSYDKKVCTICAYFEKLNETEPLGHEYTETKVPVTCTSQGYTLYECSQCGHSYIAGYTEVKGHNYNAVVTDPTCANAGYTTHTCIDCGHSYDDTIVEALGHSYQSVVTNPTCTAEGFTTYTCVTCGHNYKADYVDMTEHVYGATVTAPTCAVLGSTRYVCETCGHSYVSDYVEKMAHTYLSTVTEPTCTKEGYTTYTCTACGDSYQADQTEVLGHNYTSVVTDPTCITEGYTTHTCMVCGHSYQNSVTAALGHVYQTVVTAPTCTEEGFTTYTCATCGETHKADYLPATEHDYIATVTAPTCTEQGYTDYLCAVCGDSYRADFADVIGHDYVATVVEPTCAQGGYTSHVCAGCGDSFTSDQTAPLAHTYEASVTAPTCTENGYTTHICANCGASYTDTPVEATGHSWVEATCTAAKYCQLCGQTEGPALGHSYIDTVTDPTCIEGGYTAHLCSRCGDSFVDGHVLAMGHSYLYSVAVTPTISTAGSLGGMCTVCGETDSVLLPVLSETHYSYVVEQKPTYLEEGVGCYAWNESAYGNFLFRVSIPVLEMEDVASVKIDTVISTPGETVVVTVNLEGAPLLRSIGISNLVFDSDVLTLISAEWLIEGELMDWDAENCKGAVAFASSTYVRGEILKLTFQVNEDALEGEYAVSCDVVLKEKSTDMEMTVPAEIEDGAVNVVYYTPGDLDNDGDVDTDDAIYLLYHTLFGEGDYPLNQSGDFDGNGVVDTDDAIYLLYHTLFGAEDYPLN